MNLNVMMFALAVILSAAPAIGQDAKTIEAAKKEGGKVVIYGSLESQVVDEVLAGFRKKTGLNAEYWRASAMSVMNRSMSEYRAGAPLYDIVMNNSDPLDHGQRRDDRQVRLADGEEISQGSDRSPSRSGEPIRHRRRGI